MYASSDMLPFPRAYRSEFKDTVIERGVKVDSKTENSTFDRCKIGA